MLSAIERWHSQQRDLPVLIRALRAVLFDRYHQLVSIISLHQQYNWEILFVNDGRTDNTLLVIEGLNAGDPRVAYIDLSRNFGKENLIYVSYMRIHSFEQQHMANILRIMELSNSKQLLLKSKI